MDIYDLWRELHAEPELAWQERRTMTTLLNFLRRESDLELIQKDGWFYGLHREGDALRTIVVRADMDAIRGMDDRAFHGCGHDGHMAMAAGAAAELKGRRIGKNVAFLFQPAEEIGAGAKRCLEIFDELDVDFILGCHNLPGFPLGKVLLGGGTFACASSGVTLRFTGKQSHAAYPELGRNPAFAAADVVHSLKKISASQNGQGMALITVVGMLVGGRDFGISAGKGEVCLTLRAERDETLAAIRKDIECTADNVARRDGLDFALEESDVFPATVNMEADAKRFGEGLRSEGISAEKLAQPMRWSEDFGWYLQRAPGFFFGVGSGAEQPGLHTPEYVFPQELLMRGAEIWKKMIELA